MIEFQYPFEADVRVELVPGVYRPVPQNPSGLRIAWLLFGALIILWVILTFLAVKTPLLVKGTAIVLLLISLGISFSHWLDRRTTILLEEGGIHYKSPLRTVSLQWQQVTELWCGPIQGGWRFLVSSPRAAFRFQSLVEIRSGGGKSIRSGYPEGVNIAKMIVTRAALSVQERRDQVLVYCKEKIAPS